MGLGLALTGPGHYATRLEARSGDRRAPPPVPTGGSLGKVYIQFFREFWACRKTRSVALFKHAETKEEPVLYLLGQGGTRRTATAGTLSGSPITKLRLRPSGKLGSGTMVSGTSHKRAACARQTRASAPVKEYRDPEVILSSADENNQ
ncbi:hypothetical protein ACU4GD_34995 [Cupriavidus basilensis]